MARPAPFAALLLALAASRLLGDAGSGGLERATPGGLAMGDNYGCSLAYSGGALIAASFGDDTDGSNSGAVFRLSRDPVCPPGGTGCWAAARLPGAGFGAGAELGWAVAFDGQCAVAGAPFAAERAGAARLYCGGGLSQTADLHPAGPTTGDQFGWSVALDGGIVAVGAPGDDDRGSNAGSVTVFEAGGARCPAKVLAADAAAGDGFGFAVALSGGWLAVGAPFADVAGADSGAVYLFERSGPCQWDQRAKLAAGGGGGTFGRAVALSGSRLAIGAPRQAGGRGNAYLATRSEAGWGAPTSLPRPPSSSSGEEYGISVAVGGGLAVVGARWDDETAEDAGAAYVFDLRTGELLAEVRDPAGGRADELGLGVATDGSWVAVGSYLNDLQAPNAGAAFACPAPVAAPPVDLSVTLASDLELTQPGASLPYTLVVSRPQGSGPPVSAAVGTRLSSFLTGVSWSCQGARGAGCSPGSGSGDVVGQVMLPPDSSVTWTLTTTVAATASGTVVSAATVSTSDLAPDPRLANNTATESTPIAPLPRADLAITLDVPAPPLAAGEAFTLTVEASNLGPDPVEDALVRVGLPAGLALEGGALERLVDLAAGARVTRTLTLRPACAAAGPLEIEGQIRAPDQVTDRSLGNNQASATVTVVPSATCPTDLSLNIEAVAPPFARGTTVQYRLIVTNQGPGIASSGTIGHAPPASLSNVTWTCTATGGTCTPAGTGPVGDTFTLAPGGLATYTVTAALDCAAPDPSTLTAGVTGGPLDDPDPADNTSSLEVVVAGACAADLAVTAHLVSPASLVPGDNVEYEVTVTNLGPAAVAGVEIEHLLPAGLLEIQTACSAGPGAACGPESEGGVSAGIDLAPGAAVTLKAFGAVRLPAPGSLYLDEVEVRSPPGVEDPDLANNLSTLSTPVTGVGALKRVSFADENPNQVHFEIEVMNAGPVFQGDNDGPELRDFLPGGLSVLSAAAESGEISFSPVSVFWSGAVPPGATVRIEVDAELPIGTAPGTRFCNQAEVQVDLNDNGQNETLRSSNAAGTPTNLDPTCFVIPGGEVDPLEIPALSQLGVLVLACALALAAVRRLGRG
ncbi:MAG TPA: IPTL-CTERM sorting domain-containing protein [Thermoanaerobaculia bacterium]|nr:IPTL-CTERM sorting domain-containing protein [Thermoanaerobaculia bacterium]